MSIKCLIVDDEENSRSIIRELLAEFCPETEIVGEADSVKTTIEQLRKLEPELVFLDINMTDGYGFEIFKHEFKHSFEVIFTTAYSEFATKAFDYAALHYILKPINVDELVDGIERYKQKHLSSTKSQVSVLHDAMAERLDRMVIQSVDGFDIFTIDKMLYFSSSGGYTYLHLSEGRHKLIGSSLNHYEQVLGPSGFCRVHAKYLVNLHHVTSFKGSRGGKVTLSNGEAVEVSVRKREEFLRRLSEITL